jgi:hypothetical protein
VSALKLIKTHGSLAAAIESLDKAKHPCPEGVDYAVSQAAMRCCFVVACFRPLTLLPLLCTP